MRDGALDHDLDPDRLSHTNEVEPVCDAVSEFQLADTKQHPAHCHRLLDDFARNRLPEWDTRISQGW
jgi:hypothetical protein